MDNEHVEDSGEQQDVPCESTCAYLSEASETMQEFYLLLKDAYIALNYIENTEITPIGMSSYDLAHKIGVAIDSEEDYSEEGAVDVPRHKTEK